MGKIILRLDRVMADRKISLKDLSDKVGVSNVNLSKMKTGKISAIRFSTLEAICAALDCQPGDISGYLDPAAIKKGILIALVSAMAAGGAAWYCLKLLRGILAPMKEGRPFEAGIADRIRSLGWAVLVGGAVSEAGKAAAAVFELKAYDLSFLQAAPLVEEVSYNYTMDLWFVWAALLVFFLSYVFRCGERLQRESDETL